MAKYFKGKSINYHTTITVTKEEEIIIWTTAILLFICFIANMFIFNDVWKIVLIDFIEFFIAFGIFLTIIFSVRHKEERIANTRISK